MSMKSCNKVITGVELAIIEVSVDGVLRIETEAAVISQSL